MSSFPAEPTLNSGLGTSRPGPWPLISTGLIPLPQCAKLLLKHHSTRTDVMNVTLVNVIRDKSVTIRVPITLNSIVLHLLLNIPYYRLRVEADLGFDEEGLPGGLGAWTAEPPGRRGVQGFSPGTFLIK